MRRRILWIIAVLLVVLVASGGLYLALRSGRSVCAPPAPALPTGQADGSPVVPTPSAGAAADPYALLSRGMLLETIQALASIQPYSGWRNSATTGEAEALDYIGRALDHFGYLAGLGLEQERQSFEVPLGTEQWDTGLELTVDGKPLQVPASGLRGSRSDPSLSQNFDSDGAVEDSERNPIVVEGPVVRIRSAEDVAAIAHGALEGRVVLLDYSVIDPIVRRGMEQAASTAATLLAHGPAGLVLVTQFSNEAGKSHGLFAQDGGALNRQSGGALPPTVVVRLEDLTAAGIDDWEGLERVKSAALRWDADVLVPALSGNLVARIPGRDPSRALILGAHIDSPNNPGAMDNASGSAVLLEVARVLDAAKVQPPMDLYLVWFGSEELGLLGSAHFVSTHPDVLDRAVAMLQIDCLTHPVDGINAQVTLVTWTESGLGADRLDWPTYLSAAAGQHGVAVAIEDVPEIYSDNYVFDGVSIPNADLIYLEDMALEPSGSLHYAAHIHDPYDTPELAREEAEALEQMARVALAAALEPLP